jgi:four helix bundle protein
MAIRNFTDLEIWQLAKEIVIKVYKLLATFPKEEKFGVVAQCKDSVTSIPANIAEGFGRFHYKDKTNFYYNARGSLEETKSHLFISDAVHFITDTNRPLYLEILRDLDRLAVKLNNFITSNKIHTT